MMVDYGALLVVGLIAGVALILAAVGYLVARARGVEGASVGRFWLYLFPLLCLAASAGIALAAWLRR
jgi:hypothetical protein